MIYKTYKFRIKDANHRAVLARKASAVNFVWNYCNEISINSARRKVGNSLNHWIREFELHKLLAGSGKDLGLRSGTIQLVGTRFVVARSKKMRPGLKWRSKKSLGWIPFKAVGVQVSQDSFKYMRKSYRFWNSRKIQGDLKCGSFNQDAKGNWFVNFTCEIAELPKMQSDKSIGIDLGLKTLATCSDGTIIENPRQYQALEKDLAKAQRARKKRRIKAIHVKIANKRKDYLHKESTKLVNKYKQIFVGDVSSSKLKKTRFAKSVSDSGWGLFKTMLDYKAIRLGVELKVTNEKHSSVTCSACSERTGPSGLGALGVREWVCSNCLSFHNRDVNAAKNILISGLRHKTQVVESRC